MSALWTDAGEWTDAGAWDDNSDDLAPTALQIATVALGAFRMPLGEGPPRPTPARARRSWDALMRLVRPQAGLEALTFPPDARPLGVWDDNLSWDDSAIWVEGSTPALRLSWDDSAVWSDDASWLES